MCGLQKLWGESWEEDSDAPGWRSRGQSAAADSGQDQALVTDLRPANAHHSGHIQWWGKVRPSSSSYLTVVFVQYIPKQLRSVERQIAIASSDFWVISTGWLLTCVLVLRQPYTFVTKEVAEATVECLMEQAEQAELSNQSQAMAERVILEEFGCCLKRIINYAGKAKTDCC